MFDVGGHPWEHPASGGSDVVPCEMCGDRAAPRAVGMCGLCLWQFARDTALLEVEVQRYLGHHAEFADWCAAHGVAA